MGTPNQYSRRLFLQRAVLVSVAAAGGGSTMLAGCASGGGGTSTESGGETSAENPFGVKEDAPLEVVIFNGGYGDDYAKVHEAMYKQKFPGRRDQARRHPPRSASSSSRASSTATRRT